jgi:hypothetical protein
MELSIAEIVSRAREPEGKLVEHKGKGANARKIRETLVAFANTVEAGEWAVFCIGIEDKTRKILGVDDPDKEQKEIHKIASEDCYPAITIDPRVIEIEGKYCILVVIPPSTKRPHFSGEALVRVGSGNKRASEALYEDLINSRSSKTWKLLQWRNKLISVKFVNAPFAVDSSPMTGQVAIPAKNRRDYRILNADQFGCDVFDESSHATQHFRLEQISPDFDHPKYRPRLRIDMQK